MTFEGEISSGVGHRGPTPAASGDLFDVLGDPRNLDDPYPFYGRLRAEKPVYANPDGTVYISRYEHASLLKNPDLRDAPEDDSRSFTLRTINQALIKAIPPRHTSLRRVAAAAFDREMLDILAAGRMRDIAEELADRLIIELCKNGIADLHGIYSLPYAHSMAVMAFGIPEPDAADLLALPPRMFSALYPKSTDADVADADEASLFLWEYLEEAIHWHRFTPDSGFDRIVRAGTDLPQDAVTRLCWMLWWGSYTSALAALDLAAITLMEQAHTTATLLENPGPWIEEALRYRSPHVINSANLTTRRATLVGEIELAPHTPVRFLLAAINRDETAFPGADTFDPHRVGRPHHIAFGEGIHSCVANQFARTALAVGVVTLASRVPKLVPVGRPGWRPYTTQRLCRFLDVQLDRPGRHGCDWTEHLIKRHGTDGS